MKKLVSILLVMMLAGQAWAINIDGWYYSLRSNGTAMLISDPTNHYDYKGDFPEKIRWAGDEYTVTEIGPNAFAYSIRKTVNIPKSVTKISASAFYNCSNLESVTIANSVIEIDERAFEGCDKLKYNQYVGGKYLGNSNNPFLYLIAHNSNYVSIKEGCKVISSDALRHKAFVTDVSEVSIPTSVTHINSNAFKDCDALTRVKFASIESLCNICFGNEDANPLMKTHELYINGENVSELIIPNTVTSIGNYAFCGCGGISRLIISNSVTSIGSGAFSGCDGLVSVMIGDNVNSISGDVFNNCSKLKKVVCFAMNPPILNGGDPFEYADTIYVRPNSVESYRNATIWDSKVIMPFATKSSSEEGTVYGSNLFLLAEPTNDYHFVKWNDDVIDNPRTIIIASDTSATAIFEEHTVITDAAVEATCTTTGLTEGSHCSVCGVILVAQNTIPALGHTEVIDAAVAPTLTETGLTEGKHCSVCNNVLIAQDVVPEISRYFSIDVLNYYVTSTETPYTAAVTGGIGTDIVIPETVTYNNLIISVTSISDEAFWQNENLKSVVIGDAVTKIGDMAFSQCPGITSVTIGKSVTHIGANAFNQSGIKTVVIPESVNSIGDAAFLNCGNITSITIPKSVEKMGSGVFQFCSNLTITCEVESKPNGWNAGWNPSNCPVIWAEAQNTGEENQEGNEGGENGGEEQGGENNNPGTAVSESTANAINIYAHGNTIVVKNATEEIRVYDAMGRMIGMDAINRVRTEIRVSTAGLYIVKIGNVAKRVMVN